MQPGGSLIPGGIVNPRKANGWRRRQAQQRVRAAYTCCHICGKPIDKTLPAGDPWSLEVDEIIPVSKGGSPTDFNNLQAAHRICNEIRGNHSIEWARRKLNGIEPLKTSRMRCEHSEI